MAIFFLQFCEICDIISTLSVRIAVDIHAGVSEWQTMRTQNPLVATPCGFKSHHRHQIRTSRLIEALRFFSFVLVSNKPFACAVFGIHRVKVLPSDNVFSLSAAHFLCRNCPKISISIKNETVKIYPDLSCQSFTLSCQRLEFSCQRYDLFLVNGF